MSPEKETVPSAVVSKAQNEVDELINKMEAILQVAPERPVKEDESRKIKQLIGKLGDPDFAEREKAHAQLRSMKFLARRLLQKALKDSDLEVRMRARDLYKQLKIMAPSVTQADLVKNSLTRLAELGPATEDAVPFLTEWLEAEMGAPNLDSILHIKLLIIGTLGKNGPAAKSAVPALIDMLKDQNWSVKVAAAEALGKIGRDAEKAVPALVGLIGKKEIVPGRKVWPRQEDINAPKRAAAVALGKIGLDTQDVRDRLQEALENPWIKKEVAAALDAIVEKSKNRVEKDAMPDDKTKKKTDEKGNPIGMNIGIGGGDDASFAQVTVPEVPKVNPIVAQCPKKGNRPPMG